MIVCSSNWRSGEARTALLVLPLLLAACNPNAAAKGPDQVQAEPPRPVQAAMITIVPDEHTHVLTGTIRARRETDMAFRVGGRIIARKVEIGQAVQSGALLAELDSSDLRLTLRGAEAGLASAQAAATNANAEASRAATLRKAGYVAAAFEEGRGATARSAREAASRASADLELQRNRLSYAELRAPFDGTVIALLAEAGQVMAEGATVLRIAQQGDPELLVPVPERLLPLLRDANASVEIWSNADQRLAATLREVSPQADPLLRTYAARFSLTDAPAWLALGMTGSVRLAGTGPLQTTVPLSALHDRGQGPMIWRIADGTVQAVPVRVNRLDEDTASIDGPLADGDRIVSLGAQLLHPGQAVRIVDTRLAGTLR
jgi:RND family efflux transporter MFP subunit